MAVGEGQRARYFVRDLGLLLEQWRGIEEQMQQKAAPCCVFREPDLIERTVRDFLTDEIDAVFCDDADSVTRMQDLVGQISSRSKKRIQHHSEPVPIFEKYNVQKQIDDAFHRQVWLKCGGYIVIDETEAWLETNPCDAAILDIGMPDIDGITLISLVRKRHPHLPIVIFTGLGYDEEMMKAARVAGANGYVSKGLGPNEIYASLMRVISQSSPA